MSDVQDSQIASVEEYSRCFIRLQHLWKENKKTEFKNQMQEYLSLSADPYRMTLVNVKLCPDVFRSKQDSLAANILVELQTFMNQYDAKKFESCLTEKLQREVYELAIRQKNTGMLKILVKTFHLVNRGQQYLPSLKSKLQEGHYKEVCLLVSLLNLEPHFTTTELIVPLFLEDSLSLADDILQSSPTHQKELAIFLDDIIGKKISVTDLQKYKIKDMKKIRSNKILSGILAKFLKRFNLDPAICPNFRTFRASGGLRYIFYKYHIEKGLQRPMFYSLIDDTLKENPEVLSDLLNLFVDYYDAKGALPYIRKFKISPEDLPEQIKDALANSSELEQEEFCEEEPPNQESWDDEIGNFYTLDISNDQIVIVDTADKFDECYCYMKESPLLAIDAEWKPTFGIGTTEQAALLQFATTNMVFLLDLVSLQPVLQGSHWQRIGELFSDTNLTKLGYGIKGDFRVLGTIHSDMKKGIASATNVIDFDVTKNILLEEYPNIFSYSGEVHKGLSDLVYRCFGLPLNKQERFSNWAARPLTNLQITYAALDVRCLINVCNYLNQKAAELHLPDWKKVKRKPVKVLKKPRQHPSVTDNTVDARQVAEPGGERESIRAGDFQVVCDTMVQGLAKQLRSCGVDAVALENGEGWDQCLHYYERERRVVLTRGRSYQALMKHIPCNYIYNVTKETAQDQLAEIIEAFKVKVTINDVFARCSKCNADHYLVLPSSVVATLQARHTNIQEKKMIECNEGCDKACEVVCVGHMSAEAEKCESEGRGTVDMGGKQNICHSKERNICLAEKGDEWVECEGGRVNVSTGKTEGGVVVLAGMVPKNIVESTMWFYACSCCGKCYWEGSHHKKVLNGRLKNIVELDGSR